MHSSALRVAAELGWNAAQQLAATVTLTADDAARCLEEYHNDGAWWQHFGPAALTATDPGVDPPAGLDTEQAQHYRDAWTWSWLHHVTEHAAGVLAAIDLDNVEHCTPAPCCHTCGRTTDLRSLTVDTSIGIACLTLCATCVSVHDVRPMPVAQAMTRVAEHCAHLGLDLDTMGIVRRTQAPQE
ncbi:hypothetical protein [Saccharopolyspora rosea]|uniref:Uncharacterized protein n=1 Tax=Saccharopolyspora rosea TaxID=524884 RepID=A0ABW3FLM3_9PSEU|nr:hypothetical protein [Saccharopolyspora rosea]